MTSYVDVGSDGEPGTAEVAWTAAADDDDDDAWMNQVDGSNAEELHPSYDSPTCK